MENKVKTIYQYLYEKAVGKQFSNFRYSERDQTMIDKFVSKLNYSIGDDWLWNYFCYQFQRYVDLKTRLGKGIVPLSWVIGEKALKRYREATEEELFYINEFKIRYNVKSPLFEPETVKFSDNYRNNERKRFTDLNRRLIHCRENELFDSKNKVCFSCKNKEYCK